MSEQVALAVSATLSKILPAVPGESDMQDVEDQSRAPKVQRTGVQEAGKGGSAFAAALDADKDEDMEEDKDDGPWIQHGSNAKVQELRRKLQMDKDMDDVVGKRFQTLRMQTPKALQKAQRKQAPTVQPSDGSEQARPSLWDSRRWDERVRGAPQESDVDFPPLGGATPGARRPAGTPARAGGTGSFTGSQSGSLPAAGQAMSLTQGTGSTTGQQSAGSSTGAATLVTPPAQGQATPPAEGSGSENGRGDGTAA